MSRSSLPRLFLVAVLGLMLPVAGWAQDSAKFTSAIQSINKQFIDYMMKRDAKGLGSLYFEDALLQFQGAPTQAGRAAIEAYWAEAMAGGVQSVELRSEEIVQWTPDVGVQVGTYTIVVPGADGAAPVTFNGKFGAVYQRRAGQWKVIFDAGSD
jgi:uncharacterized protein (TIGR02246 family)